MYVFRQRAIVRNFSDAFYSLRDTIALFVCSLRTPEDADPLKHPAALSVLDIAIDLGFNESFSDKNSSLSIHPTATPSQESLLFDAGFRMTIFLRSEVTSSAGSPLGLSAFATGGHFKTLYYHYSLPAKAQQPILALGLRISIDSILRCLLRLKLPSLVVLKALTSKPFSHSSSSSLAPVEVVAITVPHSLQSASLSSSSPFTPLPLALSGLLHQLRTAGLRATHGFHQLIADSSSAPGAGSGGSANVSHFSSLSEKLRIPFLVKLLPWSRPPHGVEVKTAFAFRFKS